MTVRRNRHAQPRILAVLAVVLFALLAGSPAAQTRGSTASGPSTAVVLTNAFHGDIGVVSRLDASTGGDLLARVDLLAQADNPMPPSKSWSGAPRPDEQAIGRDLADVPRARAPPSEEMT